MMTFAFSLLSSGAKYSYADEVLRIISYEGYFPQDKLDEFKNYVSNKYGKAITIEKQYAAEEQDFFNAIRGRRADVSLATHNWLKDERYNYIKNKIVLQINLEHIPNYSKGVKYHIHSFGQGVFNSSTTSWGSELRAKSSNI